MKQGKKHKSDLKTEKFPVNGMVCASCEKIISRQVHRIDGVMEINADYAKGTCEVTYDAGKTDLAKIQSAIAEKGYTCGTEGASGFKDLITVIGALVIIIGAYTLISPTIEMYAPAITKDVSVPLLFIIGLFTGFHCIAMCGGFVVSYTAKDAAEGRTGYLSHIKYGVSKTVSYTVVGAIFGLIGSFFTFTPLLRGVAAVLAGLFLIIFGLNMAGLLKSFRNLRLKTPGFLDEKIRGNNSPIAIGVLNSLMIACGPLQAIYLLAAASGSPFKGAMYLFAFGAGTLPLLLGFGVVTSFLSHKMTNKILKYSGVVVLLLGLIMVNRGIALTGSGYDVNTLTSSATTATLPAAAVQAATASGERVELDSEGYQVIHMNVTLSGWQPDKFTLKTGVPVKWVIDGQQIVSCNSAIQVPKYNLKFDIKKGTQTITFTPTEAGTVPWSCWMGMIPGTFIVKDDVATTGAAQVAGSPKSDATQNAPTTIDADKPPVTSAPQTQSATPAENPGYQTIYMNVTAAGWQPNAFVLKTGMPVKWVIDGQELTGCNSGIKVPSMGLQFNIRQGQQTIEFTPTTAGTIPWSCLMGMIQGTFVVKDDIDPNNQAQMQQALSQAPAPPKSSGGGCGCGMMR